MKRILKIHSEIVEINTDYYVSAEDLLDLEEDVGELVVVDEAENPFPQRKLCCNGGKA